MAGFVFVLGSGPVDAGNGVTGPEYFVDVQLKNGDTTLGSKKMLWDPGSTGTSFSKSDAKDLGLLDANFDPTASLLMPNVKGEGTNANNQDVGGYSVSIGLSVDVVGKDKDGHDLGGHVQTPEKKSVVYIPGKPAAGANDANTLLGTNIIAELPKEERKPDGSVSYTVVPPPADPKQTIDIKQRSNNFRLYNPATGETVVDPLISNALWSIEGARIGAATADFVYTGSPVSIISQALENAILAPQIGTFDLFNTLPNIYQNLHNEGFVGPADPGPFQVVSLPELSLPAESGGFIDFLNVPVLVNPASFGPDNIFGTNVFANAGVSVFEDFSTGQIRLVPEPSTIALLGAGLAGLAWICRRPRVTV